MEMPQPDSPRLAASPEVPILQSFFMGGFECATHRRHDGTRIDVIASARHDLACEEDYRLLASAGVRTVRDGLRWHLIESAPGIFDWSSFLPMLRAAHATQTQVLWDLCHWGIPDWLDIVSAQFPERFGLFAAAAAALIRAESDRAGIATERIYAPVNEISFWSWIGGDLAGFYPYATGRGPELKLQLVRASLAAIHAIRAVDPAARFLQVEPIIHIAAAADRPEDELAAAQYTASQFEAWDMIAGRSHPELGGSAAMLDLIGVNYYWNNQWIHNGERTPTGHPLHRPLHLLLADVWNRYRRPMLITETGTEAPAAPGWFGYVAAEARLAMRLGVPLAGICTYPIADYPGWDDARHCPCGLIEIAPGWTTRSLRADLLEEMNAQATLFPRPASPQQPPPPLTDSSGNIK